MYGAFEAFSKRGKKKIILINVIVKYFLNSISLKKKSVDLYSEDTDQNANGFYGTLILLYFFIYYFI